MAQNRSEFFSLLAMTSLPLQHHQHFGTLSQFMPNLREVKP